MQLSRGDRLAALRVMRERSLYNLKMACRCWAKYDDLETPIESHLLHIAALGKIVVELDVAVKEFERSI